MAETYRIHRALCEVIDNKKKEYTAKVLNTICKASKKEIKITKPRKKLGKEEPIIFLVNDKMHDEIECDINKIGEVKNAIEEMKILNDIEKLMKCK